MAEEWRTAIVEGDPITKLSGKISVEQLASHASTHEYGGEDPVRNLDYLAIRDEKFIDENRKVVKDVHILKSNPQLTIEETEAETSYPYIEIKSPQRVWRIQLDPSGSILIYDVTGDKPVLKINADGQVQIPTVGDSAGLLIGGDTQIYRREANKLALASGDHIELDEIYLNALNRDVRLYRGGADLLKTDDNFEALSLRVSGYTIVDSSRQLQNIDKVIQNLLISKSYPVFTIEETVASTYYPRLDIKNPQRTWRILGGPLGELWLRNQSDGYNRMIVWHNTAADSDQFVWYNSLTGLIMKIDYEGDLTISGKLTQGACPEFSKMSFQEIVDFIKKCRDKPEPKKDDYGRILCDLCGKPFGDGGCNVPSHWNQFVDKHFHKTQEEVMAIMHLTLNLLERVEKMETLISKETRVINGE
ncbi:MAG: hypothetical protein QXO00_02425 [Candidatus Bathyarchaeia archaeon]